MCPRTYRALVAWIITTAVTISPGVASAAEDVTFALPATGTPSSGTPFDRVIVGSETRTGLTRPVIVTPPFDFPDAEPIASCRGCQVPGWFDPPPFTL
jgi:hypothetical protein